MDVDGTDPTRLTEEDTGFLGMSRFYREYAPSWSGDGRRIYFMSDRPGNYEIFTIDVESGQPRESHPEQLIG